MLTILIYIILYQFDETKTDEIYKTIKSESCAYYPNGQKKPGQCITTIKKYSCKLHDYYLDKKGKEKNTNVNLVNIMENKIGSINVVHAKQIKKVDI